MIERLWRGVAIISASEDGYRAGEVIRDKLRGMEIPVVHYRYRDARLDLIWSCYDAVVFVMALEGAARIVCRYARSKAEDPAVVVVDDGMNYVIPLLGGHWGANELARELAEALGSRAVITTAAELKGRLSVERIAEMLIARVLNPEAIVRVNSALLRDEVVCLDGVDADADFGGNIKLNSDDCRYIISLLDKPYGGDRVVVRLKPLKLSIGVGSRSSVDLGRVRKGIEMVLERLGVGRERVGVIASIRPEIAEIAREFNVGFRLVSREELNNFSNPCLTPPSETLTKLGLRGVAEVAALIAGGPSSRLVLRKVAVDGEVTIAVAAYDGG